MLREDREDRGPWKVLRTILQIIAYAIIAGAIGWTLVTVVAALAT